MSRKLAVFGATGGTGRALIQQGLAAGHQVSAFARRPSAIEVRHERLTVVGGDVLDPAAVHAMVPGHDVVLSALGIGYSRAATTVYSQGTANIVAAMRAAGVRRLICLSTGSLELPGRTDIAQHLFFMMVLHRVLRRPYADMVQMEATIRSSGLDWTLVRAARLTDGRLTGRYRTAHGCKLPRAWSISRADVADCMLRSIDTRAVFEQTVELAY